MNARGTIILLAFILCFTTQILCQQVQLYGNYDGSYGVMSNNLGDIFVSSSTENVILQIDSETFEPFTFAGTGTAGFLDGNVTEAQFNSPRAILFPRENPNTLLVADYGNNAIRKIQDGMVTTLVSGLSAGPVSLTLVPGGATNPTGIYAVLSNGQIVLVNNLPANDVCKSAINMGTLSPVAPLEVTGSTAHATADTTAKCGSSNGYPKYGVWYTFVGNGNAANISTCSQQAGYDATLYAYRDNSPHSQSCEDLYCYGVGATCEFNTFGTTIQICTEVGVKYYVIVDGVVGSRLGEFTLTITDVGLPSSCQDCSCVGIQCGTNACGGYCTDYECPSGICQNGQCVVDNINAQCTGAISLGSTNITLDPATYAGTVPSVVHGVGSCTTVYYPGLWYTFKGTGYEVEVNTCSVATNFYPRTHIYQQGSVACEVGLLCVGYSYSRCPQTYGSSFTFCAQDNETYYVLVESTSPNPTNEHFQISLIVSERTCIN